MIDWTRTKKSFGYGSVEGLTGKRPKVICRCDTCKTKFRTMAVRVKKSLINGQMVWECPSCVMLRKEQSSRASRQGLGRWTDTEYASARSDSSLTLWQNKKFRSKHSAAVKESMAAVDMSAILVARYSSNVARDVLRAKSLSLFNDEKFKANHKAAMSRPEVKQKISDGLKRVWEDAAYREKALRSRLKQKTRTSKLQTMLYTYLDDLGVDYHKEGEDTAIGFYLFDCLIPRKHGKQILVECQGDYWHSSADAQRRDKSKFTYVEKYFPDYTIIYFWEREFYQKDKVINRLRSLLGVDQNIIDFDLRDVTIGTAEQAKHFLDLYHYMGPGREGRKIGAFLNGEMIALAVFTSPQRQNISNKFSRPLSDIIECSRFCVHPSYQKRNFASWFLSRCAKQFKDKLLISYADTTAGHTGTIYKAANWQLHHEVPPGYWYADVDGFVMHKKTLYNRAVNLGMREADFAEKYGFIKIYGGKKLCFVKEV